MEEEEEEEGGGLMQTRCTKMEEHVALSAS